MPDSQLPISKNWLVRKLNQTEATGPFLAQEVIELVRTRKISAADFVQKRGTERWVRVADVPKLRPHLQTAGRSDRRPLLLVATLGVLAGGCLIWFATPQRSPSSQSFPFQTTATNAAPMGVEPEVAFQLNGLHTSLSYHDFQDKVIDAPISQARRKWSASIESPPVNGKRCCHYYLTEMKVLGRDATVVAKAEKWTGRMSFTFKFEPEDYSVVAMLLKLKFGTPRFDDAEGVYWRSGSHTMRLSQYDHNCEIVLESVPQVASHKMDTHFRNRS